MTRAFQILEIFPDHYVVPWTQFVEEIDMGMVERTFMLWK
jgi:hypothetical protein